MDNNPAFQQTNWSLTDLIPGRENLKVEEAFQILEEQVARFEKVRDSLHPNLPAEVFMGAIHDMEMSNRLANSLYAYATLSFSADTQDQNALTLLARVEQFLTELGNRSLFFSLWWKALDDENAARLMSTSGDYRYWLEEMRHFKPYTLSEPEEKVINLKNVTGVSALSTLYDSITNRYIFKMEVNGEVREMTRGELIVYVRSPEPALREAAYRELNRVYGYEGPILGQMYQTLVRDWRNEQLNLRGFSSPIAVRNLGNDIPDSVVDLLLDTCQKNAHLFQRFFQLKARLLGLDRLHRSDIYAPIGKSEKAYPFDQAAGIVLDSFREFDPLFAQHARRVFDHKHVDSEVRRGKRSGAFCLTALPDLTPWVLLNYQGRTSDVSTMAHELGHAIHSMVASEHSLFTFHASLPLAETASTFGEMLLVDRLLREEPDTAVRRELLFSRMDDSYATILRQAFFALFERQAHEMIHQGASVDELSEAYLENLRRQFADSVDVNDEFRWEWVSIPHIYHTPFYVYAYSFGQLLVLSLYRQYTAEGDAFIPRYRQLLAAGGSQSPADILSAAGIDIHNAGFWQGGFDLIREWIEALERDA